MGGTDGRRLAAGREGRVGRHDEAVVAVSADLQQTPVGGGQGDGDAEAAGIVGGGAQGPQLVVQLPGLAGEPLHQGQEVVGGRVVGARGDGSAGGDGRSQCGCVAVGEVGDGQAGLAAVIRVGAGLGIGGVPGDDAAQMVAAGGCYQLERQLR